MESEVKEPESICHRCEQLITEGEKWILICKDNPPLHFHGNCLTEEEKQEILASQRES